MRREILYFLVIGTLTVCLDFLTYRLCLYYHLYDTDFCKMIGFIAGTLFAYFANKYYTFASKNHASGSYYRFIIVYSISLSFNVFINSLMLTVLKNSLAIYIAFIIATAISSVTNFLGMKLFAFKETYEKEYL